MRHFEMLLEIERESEEIYAINRDNLELYEKSGISISIYSENVLILHGTEHFICVNSLATCVTF